MKSRELLEQICHENDDIPEDPDLFRPRYEPAHEAPQTPNTLSAPPATQPPTAAPTSAQPKKTEEWVVGSMRGSKIEELWGPEELAKMSLCVVEIPADPYGRRPNPVRVGVVGSQGTYGTPGDPVRIKIDSMQGGGSYRYLPDKWSAGKLLAVVPLSRANMRLHRVRALYHFD